jgi:hypothetical protein
VLSPDFRGAAPVVDLSSLDRPPAVGVEVDVRFGDLAPAPVVGLALSEGVDGRLAGRCAARLSSSARRSCSDWADALCLEALEVLVLAGFGAGASVPRSSNCANSSSSVGADLAFLDAILNKSKRA